jgi:hypothetical protein
MHEKRLNVKKECKELGKAWKNVMRILMRAPKKYTKKNGCVV